MVLIRLLERWRCRWWRGDESAETSDACQAGLVEAWRTAIIVGRALLTLLGTHWNFVGAHARRFSILDAAEPRAAIETRGAIVAGGLAGVERREAPHIARFGLSFDVEAREARV